MGAEVAGKAAEKLLDSGHIVVSVFMLLTCILLAIIILLFRLWMKERKENIKLVDQIVRVQVKVLVALREMKSQIETLLKTVFNDNHK